ncbi:hypothetical protein M0R45_015823 [Rubus argutus]|uniref:Wall-associated receptor kinase galacturonan-binding domain-containing protein n=1 Tax=Rubus argutus TaxID=59490 RepID=A0AAW1XSQ1_RUBAR
MFKTASLLFSAYTVSLLLSLSLPLSIRSQTHGASVECTPSCGNINIRSPFRLQGDPGYCGNKAYTLSCETNETSQSHHAVLYLFCGKYYVQAINYINYTIRVVDAGVHKIKDNYFSDPVYPLSYFNFSEDYSDPYTIYYEYFESPDASFSFTKYLTVPLVFLSCTNPMNLSNLFVETAPCIGSHSSSDSSLSTVYSYFKLGRLDKYGYPDMSPADVGLSCTITLMVMVSPTPAPTDKYSQSCEGIYKHLAYGFELSWLPHECTEKCRSEYYGCAVNHNNTGIECYNPIQGGRPEILNYLKNV